MKGKKRSSWEKREAKFVSDSMLLIVAKKGMEERSCHPLGYGSKDTSGDLCCCRQLPLFHRCSFPQPYTPIIYAYKPETFYGSWKLAAETETVGWNAYVCIATEKKTHEAAGLQRYLGSCKSRRACETLVYVLS